jgi:D-alanyl-D-alanine carboxypeptidase (penicillin-binding protein 5/6)
LGAAAVVVLVVGLVLALTGGPSAPAVASVRITLPAWHAVAPGDPALPWPSAGESAVAVPSVGYAAQSGPEHAAPVASMTKVMTAYVILHDHPLATGSDGPRITVTAADAADYTTDIVTTQASVEIQSGEVLTERQALDGLLVHSANDLAFTLACWDAGSLSAFVAKMNSTAQSLGMDQTHFADASGYTPQSVSTPADLLKVASAAMADPAFAQAVAMPAVTLPVAGTVSSYTPLLPGGIDGTPGVVGVKSGYTTAAGGGDILAYQATVDGRPLTVLAAVTSLRGPSVLDTAGHLDLAVAQAAAAAVVPVPVVTAGEQVGTAQVPGATVPVVATSAATLLGWPGQRVRQTVVVTRHPVAGSRAGAPVGTALFTLGEQQVAVPVRTAGRLGDR